MTYALDNSRMNPESTSSQKAATSGGGSETDLLKITLKRQFHSIFLIVIASGEKGSSPESSNPCGMDSTTVTTSRMQKEGGLDRCAVVSFTLDDSLPGIPRGLFTASYSTVG